MHWSTGSTQSSLVKVALSLAIVWGMSFPAAAQRGGRPGPGGGRPGHGGGGPGHGGGGLGGGGVNFPIVIGPTGRPYGPTQAEYQYQRRYGHASPGARPGSTAYVNGYPGGAGYGVPGVSYGARSYGYGFGIDAYPYGGLSAFPYGGYSYGYGDYGGYGGYGAYPNIFLQQNSSTIVVPQPGTILNWNPAETRLPTGAFSAPMTDPTFSDAQWNVGRAVATPVAPANKVVDPSSPEEQIRAIRLVDAGDKELKQIHYATAALKYRDAMVAARDQATPRFRLALTHAARSKFADAVEQYQLGLALDPTWPQHTEHLDELLGENTLAKKYLIHRIAEWANEDIRDPQRLFLLGVILHQDGDERAQEVLKTAVALAGPEPYLTPFFHEAATAQIEQAPAPNIVPNADIPAAPAGEAPPPIPVAPGPVLPNRP